MGHIDPTKEVFAQFRANDRPGPIHMLNLVRLRAQAAYPDGRKATGAEAYAAYGRESGPVFERLGGRIVWQGRFELMLIGPQDERWDHCFIAEYPSVAAFAEMIRDPVYREAVKHRQAAVEDSRLIRHAVLPVGKTFGEIPVDSEGGQSEACPPSLEEHHSEWWARCALPTLRRLKKIGGPEGPPIASFRRSFRLGRRA
jgi:uncharacterized protein (DUF1330 family)